MKLIGLLLLSLAVLCAKGDIVKFVSDGGSQSIDFNVTAPTNGGAVDVNFVTTLSTGLGKCQ